MAPIQFSLSRGVQPMKNAIVAALIVVILLGAIQARAAGAAEPPGVAAAAVPAAAPAAAARERQRIGELQNRLCRVQELNCEYVSSIFGDARLAIYQPPAPTPEAPPAVKPPRELERNPYFTKRFGLITPESLERCRAFIGAHEAALAAAEEMFGVTREVICGHLRLETNFGIATRLTPNPFGTRAAVRSSWCRCTCVIPRSGFPRSTRRGEENLPSSS